MYISMIMELFCPNVMETCSKTHNWCQGKQLGNDLVSSKLDCEPNSVGHLRFIDGTGWYLYRSTSNLRYLKDLLDLWRRQSPTLAAGEDPDPEHFWAHRSREKQPRIAHRITYWFESLYRSYIHLHSYNFLHTEVTRWVSVLLNCRPGVEELNDLTMILHNNIGANTFGTTPQWRNLIWPDQ